jgi:hypothetical protein
VVLTVGNRKYTQALTVEMDPRVKASQADLQKQFELSRQIYQQLLEVQPAFEKATAARVRLKEMRQKTSGAQASAIDSASQQLDALLGTGGRRRRGAAQTDTLTGVRGSLLEMLGVLQDVDAAPTTQATETVPKLQQSASAVVARWREFEMKQLQGVKQP